MKTLLTIFLLLLFTNLSQAHDFHLGKDSLMRQLYAGTARSIKSNSKGDFVVLYKNCIIEVKNKDTNIIKLDMFKSDLMDIFYEDNGDIYVTDNYEFYGINEFKKYNGKGWDMIYKPSLPGKEDIRGIAKDDKGNFWINIMRMYFIKYDGEKFTKFYGKDTLDGQKDQDYYPNLQSFSESLVFYKGELYYFGLNEHLCSINPITGVRKLYEKTLYRTPDTNETNWAMFPKLRLANDKLWMIQYKCNPCSFDGKDFTKYHLDEGKISTELSGSIYFSFDVDSDNSIWISGSFHDKTIDSNRFGILHYYNTENYQFYKVRTYFKFDQYTTIHPLKCLPNGSTIFYIPDGMTAVSRFLYWGDEDQNPILSVDNKHQFNVSSAYPNPVKERVTLQFEANSSLDIALATIDVYNYMGQLIQGSVQTSCSFNSSEGKGIINADLTSVPPGFYVLLVNIGGDKEMYAIMKK